MSKICPDIENVQNVTKRCPKFGYKPNMRPKAALSLDTCPKCDQKVLKAWTCDQKVPKVWAHFGHILVTYVFIDKYPKCIQKVSKIWLV